MTKRQQKIVDHLEAIRKRNRKTLTPNAVVEDARNPDSPLHKFFDWDDTKAAQKWRLEQARNLIARFRVEVVTTSQTIAAPYYIHDPRLAHGRQGYTTPADIKDKTTVAVAALEYEFNRAMAQLTRAEEVAVGLGLEKEFAALMREAKLVEASIGKRKPKGKGDGQQLHS